ncbi:hypothetical protein O6P43_027077 [Quillaja saponaria]|uniref:Uncharacterized protein n=1 Tax=Quillaja saponaria TaxID=32244 RepID=A0AAD7PCW6_QUISA|nr:hypothetical protein O6P43_027077 [Quillaja saponaria]
MPEALSHSSDQLSRRSSVLLNGILHWILELSEVKFMHTFHLGNESFGKIELPSNSADISLVDNKHILLFKSKESLAAGFWSPPFEHLIIVKKLLYDPVTQQMKNTTIDESSCNANVRSYMETLVPIPSEEGKEDRVYQMKET